MSRYKDLGVADREKDKWNKQGLNKFCPMINSMCRPDCVSFQPASIQDDLGQYRVFEPGCKNKTLTSR